MGQCMTTSDQEASIMRENGSSRKRRFYRSGNGNLSATFHILDIDLQYDLLNINSATVEQLMTLPGISRVTAENIIEYRSRICGFRKVEDLALVCGVGATKLEQFRTEICVSRRKINNSYDSSLTQSLESLQTNDGVRSSPCKLVNINTANVFQLMSVSRMTQEMAANIVHYRDRKGPFKSVESLSKVKGLPPERLAIVKIYLTVDSSVSQPTSVQNSVTHNCVDGKRPIGHRRTNSAPSGFGKSRSCDPSTKDFYELVSSLVTRPLMSEVFDFSYSGRPVLRIASWNLQDFVVQKARNPGVQEVVCRTILENGLSIVAVQEIASREALSLIASELNEPKLYPVQEWRGDRGKWHTIVPSYLSNSENSSKRPFVNGFLYDTSRGLQLQDSNVLYLPPEKLIGLNVTCQPFLAYFKIKNLDFVVVTFSLISESCVSKLIPLILEQLKQKLEGKNNIFLVGDFILPPGHTVFEVVSSQGYSNLLPVETNVTNPDWHEESHIWSSLNVRKIFSGRSGVICDGLSHLAIPDGWKWGGAASKHCPVWAELYTEEEPTPVMNGICKAHVSHANCSPKSVSAEKDKSRGFWQRNWRWRNHNNHPNHHKVVVNGEMDSAVVKENSSL